MDIKKVLEMKAKREDARLKAMAVLNKAEAEDRFLSDEEQIPRAELRAALDYLQESGYIAVRTVKDHTPAHISDLTLEDLECKLLPKGTQLIGGHIKDPLVKP